MDCHLDTGTPVVSRVTDLLLGGHKFKIQVFLDQACPKVGCGCMPGFPNCVCVLRFTHPLTCKKNFWLD